MHAPKFNLGMGVWIGYMGLQAPFTAIIRRVGLDNRPDEANHEIIGVRLIGEYEEQEEPGRVSVIYRHGWEYLIARKRDGVCDGWFNEAKLIEAGYLESAMDAAMSTEEPTDEIPF
jgi:hypothetical protein